MPLYCARNNAPPGHRTIWAECARLGDGGGRCDDSAVGAALVAMLAAAARSQAEASALRCVPAPERLMLPGTSPRELERRPKPPSIDCAWLPARTAHALSWSLNDK